MEERKKRQHTAEFKAKVVLVLTSLNAAIKTDWPLERI